MGTAAIIDTRVRLTFAGSLSSYLGGCQKDSPNTQEEGGWRAEEMDSKVIDSLVGESSDGRVMRRTKDFCLLGRLRWRS